MRTPEQIFEETMKDYNQEEIEEGSFVSVPLLKTEVKPFEQFLRDRFYSVDSFEEDSQMFISFEWDGADDQ
jgi:hypothetical protein